MIYHYRKLVVAFSLSCLLVATGWLIYLSKFSTEVVIRFFKPVWGIALLVSENHTSPRFLIGIIISILVYGSLFYALLYLIEHFSSRKGLVLPREND